MAQLKAFLAKYPNRWHSFSKDVITSAYVRALSQDWRLKVDWTTHQMFWTVKAEAK